MVEFLKWNHCELVPACLWARVHFSSHKTLKDRHAAISPWCGKYRRRKKTGEWYTIGPTESNCYNLEASFETVVENILPEAQLLATAATDSELVFKERWGLWESNPKRRRANRFLIERQEQNGWVRCEKYSCVKTGCQTNSKMWFLYTSWLIYKNTLNSYVALSYVYSSKTLLNL